MTDQLDLIKKIALGIASAEGYGLPDAIPTDANNPGDLCLGNRFDLTVAHKGMFYTGNINGVTIYPHSSWDANIEDHEDGCAALYREIRLMLTNKSLIYSSSMTIQQIGDKYTKTDPDDWAKTVAEKLGVSTDTSLDQLTGESA